jgi:hypothetical protein
MRLGKVSREDVLPGLAFLLLPLAFFPELFFCGKTLFHIDFNIIHYPLRVFAAQNWQAGSWPLWNPYSLCGFPLLAEGQVGVLYPPSVLFLLPVPPYFALNCFVMLHLAMAAIFTYALSRSLGMGRAGASLAALSFGFGGMLTAEMSKLNIMTGIVWMPLVLCLVIRAVERKSVAWAALGGLALALQILTAQPQMVFYTLLLVAAYAAYRALLLAWDGERRREMAWPGLLAVLVVVVASGLAAAQLLPTLELWRISDRSQGVSYAEMIFNSMPPLQLLLELLIPNLFGNMLLTYGGAGNFDELYFYVGLIPLLLCVGAWWRRDDPRVRFFFLLLLLALLLAFGAYTPLYSVLQYLPGFSLFRRAARWVSVVGLMLALLAGYGLDELTGFGRSRLQAAESPTGAGSRNALARTLLVVAATVGVLALGAALLVWLRRDEALAWVGGQPFSEDTRQVLSVALRRFLRLRPPKAQSWLMQIAPWIAIPGVAFFLQVPVLLGLLWAYVKGKVAPAGIGYALLGLTLLDLLAAGGTTVTRMEDASYWQYDAGIVDLVREEAGTYRAYAADVTSEEEREAHPEWEEPSHRAIGWLVNYAPAVYGVSSPTGHLSPLRLERFDLFNRDVPGLRGADMMSVKLLLIWGPLDPGLASLFREVHVAGALHVYENPRALPRAYVAHRVEVVADGAAALRRLGEDDFDPGRSVVVEGPVGGLALSGEGITPALIRHYEPLRVVVESESRWDGLLLLTDSYYPGWRAYVDGKEEPILRGNYLFRAVPVPAGKHTVEFVYAADSFKLGLAISGVTAGLLLLLAGARLFARLKREGR